VMKNLPSSGVVLAITLFLTPLYAQASTTFDTSSGEAFARSWNNVYNAATPTQQDALRRAFMRTVHPRHKFSEESVFGTLPTSVEQLDSGFRESLAEFNVASVEDLTSVAFDLNHKEAMFQGKTAEEAIAAWATEEKSYLDEALPAFKGRLTAIRQNFAQIDQQRTAATEAVNQAAAQVGTQDGSKILTISNVTVKAEYDYKIFLSFDVMNTGSTPIDSATFKLRMYRDNDHDPVVDTVIEPEIRGVIAAGQSYHVRHNVGNDYWFVAKQVTAPTKAHSLRAEVSLSDAYFENGGSAMASTGTQAIMNRAHQEFARNQVEFETGIQLYDAQHDYPVLLKGYSELRNEATFVNSFATAQPVADIPSDADLQDLSDFGQKLQQIKD